MTDPADPRATIRAARVAMGDRVAAPSWLDWPTIAAVGVLAWANHARNDWLAVPAMVVLVAALWLHFREPARVGVRQRRTTRGRGFLLLIILALLVLYYRWRLHGPDPLWLSIGAGLAAAALIWWALGWWRLRVLRAEAELVTAGLPANPDREAIQRDPRCDDPQVLRMLTMLRAVDSLELSVLCRELGTPADEVLARLAPFQERKEAAVEVRKLRGIPRKTWARLTWLGAAGFDAHERALPPERDNRS